MSRIVPGEGPPNAKIAIVGEAPGVEEERTRRPFVGSSGRLLNDMLARVGILRSQCYVTNVVKVRPPGNDFGSFYLDKGRKEPSKTLLDSIESLKEELQRIGPNVIVALGAEPLRALTGKSGIKAWRGSILESPVGKVIGTYHPAAILRIYTHRAIGELDLKRALEESSYPELRLPEYDFTLEPTFVQVMDFLRAGHPRLSFDIETIGTHVRCLGLAAGPRSALCVPFICSAKTMHAGSKTLFVLPEGPGSLGSYWTEDEELVVLEELQKVLSDPSVEKIAQNFPFDATLLEEDFGLEVRGLWMDTMVAQHCCYSELPKSLDFLCSVYTRTPRYSDYSASSDLSTWRYNCYDAAVTFEVSERLEEELEDLGQTSFYKDHAQPTMIALARASNRGILVDQELRATLLAKQEAKLERIKGKLLTKVGRALNPNSPKQMKEYLYVELLLSVQKNRKTGRITTDDEALERLERKYPHHAELFQLCLKHRKAQKLIGSFLKNELTSEGKMVTSYRATGTKTGRISAAKTIFGLGGNIQQVKRGTLRRIYVASPGMVFIKADLSQAEAMYVAWDAQIQWMIERYLAGTFDIHVWTAAMLLERPEETITKTERQEHKPSVHGGNYRIGPRGSAAVSKLPYAKAKRNLEKLWRAIPELKPWWARIEAQVVSTRKLVTPMGRLRVFFDRMNDHTFRSAYAQGPQSTIGDTINRAFWLLDRDLPDGAWPLLQIHDEIVCEVPQPPDPRYGQSVQLIREHMTCPIQVPGTPEPLVIPVDMAMGKNWYDLEPIEGV